MIDLYNKINILQKIGWYQDAEVTAHDKLTDLFNCLVDYFTAQDTYAAALSDDVYVGGYCPINPRTSFSNVIKKGHKYIEANTRSVHHAYSAYCAFLKSPQANDIASDTSYFLNGNLESRLIEEFIKITYQNSIYSI